MNKNIVKLCESAIMIALATVLSLLKIEWPYGGSITVCSMLPVLVIGYRYTPAWGFLTGVVYGLVQMVLGLSNFSYATSWVAVITILFLDYLIAFGVVGVSGFFKKINNQALGLGLAALTAGALRFVCHFLSGITVWAGFAPDSDTVLYSLSYNGAYMLPETVILIIGAVIVGLLIDLRSPKLGAIKRNNK